MPGQTIGTRLKLGYAGSITQSSDVVVQNRVCAGEIPFGAPVSIMPDDRFMFFGPEVEVDRFVGFAVRIVKQQQAIIESEGFYRDGELTDVLTRGSIAVIFKGTGAPTAGGAVYIRRSLNPAFPNAAIGDVEAAADGANNVLLPNVRFATGITDGSGVIEVTVTERRM